MAIWKQLLTHTVHDAEVEFDKLKYSLHERLGGPGPIRILPYRGYGTAEKLYLKGRVLEDKGETDWSDNDSLWTNLSNVFRHMESDEIPFARLRVRFQEKTQEVTANDEGYFEVLIEPQQSLPSDQLWHPVLLELISPVSDDQPEPVQATGRVLVPPASARFAVISDIDDTVVQTDATHLLRMARNVFLRNARTRLPFPGVAAFYRALFAGASGNEQNPLFYVSSSPWNLYDLLSEFFQLNDIPIGPVLFLRDWGINDEEILPTKHAEHKLRTIRQLLDFYPHLPFLLIGDSGQEDPEIYYQIAAEYQDRVLSVYVRNVSRGLDRPEAIRALAEKVVQAGGSMILAEDTEVISKHALEKGWIAPEARPDIQQEKEKDTAPPSAVEKLLGEEEQPEAPTVVVEGKPEAPSGETVTPGEIEETLEEAGKDDTKKPPTVVVEPKDS